MAKKSKAAGASVKPFLAALDKQQRRLWRDVTEAAGVVADIREGLAGVDAAITGMETDRGVLRGAHQAALEVGARAEADGALDDLAALNKRAAALPAGYKELSGQVDAALGKLPALMAAADEASAEALALAEGAKTALKASQTITRSARALEDGITALQVLVAGRSTVTDSETLAAAMAVASSAVDEGALARLAREVPQRGEKPVAAPA